MGMPAGDANQLADADGYLRPWPAGSYEVAGCSVDGADPNIANRDPAAFPDPDRLDITRDARHHLAFGYGVHQCMGQNLARTELQIVYGTLYRRIPTLHLAVDLDQISFKHDALAYGVYELPVAW
jgi:cytochrome P450